MDDQLIARMAAQVLAKLQDHDAAGRESPGLFADLDDAVAAARQAYRQLKTLSRDSREAIIRAVREAAYGNAALLSGLAVQETGMGRVADKIIKNELAAQKTPGTEILYTEACSGDRGLTIVERGPYGVIGAITPTTNPSATIINNCIGMIAAGNAVVFSPHPSAVRTSCKTLAIINEAIVKAGGPENLLTAVARPSIETAGRLMKHPDINMLVATGGPAVVSAVLSSGKKAIGAGAGNPPAVVDQTADIAKAARDIVAGCSFDNNLPCIAEKEVIAVGSIADELMAYMRKAGAYQLSGRQTEELAKVVLTEKQAEAAAGCSYRPTKIYAANKAFIGKDAGYILRHIGIEDGDAAKVILCETEADHPFVLEELMMPVLPLVQVKDVDAAIRLAVEVEHGNRHTAIMHSKNVDNMTRLARAIETTVFVKNGPSFAGIGVGGEGFTTFTIAGPTGEGLTSAKSFARQRRCVLVDAFSIV
ncbi:aldehyde dehydrogenase EutE [Selenomonadales bacterium 4137-cl]|uniref:Aldehyde dehydrogenase EutE n=2 Tax=Anaeroselena agilis TaxID=3063788 RepID=A0ABU3NS95_9FIRM|nr:aldehyde dehydrogenase EutE [Selenomonadales bacterium 4137-cl]